MHTSQLPYQPISLQLIPTITWCTHHSFHINLFLYNLSPTLPGAHITASISTYFSTIYHQHYLVHTSQLPYQPFSLQLIPNITWCTHHSFHINLFLYNLSPTLPGAHITASTSTSFSTINPQHYLVHTSQLPYQPFSLQLIPNITWCPHHSFHINLFLYN